MKDLAAREALRPEGPEPDITEADLAVFELPEGTEAERAERPHLLAPGTRPWQRDPCPERTIGG
ncbi:MAG: hypothetical protein ACRDTT_31600 [Pseudonocardiaceae bacterium]